MKNWDEIKYAYYVAKFGTVSAAADALGVHRATVIRNVNALEEAMEAKLFIRHSHGYSMTEAGNDLVSVAAVTQEQFDLLSDRIRNAQHNLSGEFIITIMPYFSNLVIPTVRRFQEQFENVKVHVISTVERLKLEYGEAHIAIRSGQKPESPDNVVSHFFTSKFGLFASPDYIASLPKSAKKSNTLLEHRFVARTGEAATPFEYWMNEHIPEKNRVFMSGDVDVCKAAVRHGIGAGFISIEEKEAKYPELQEILPRQDDWFIDHWLVTHRDVHHTEKVQAFIKLMN